jgi:hypothetical protein
MPIPAGPGVELPDWAPSVVQVAAYVPHRTLAEDITTNTQGEDVYRLTFDTTTRPTSEQCSRLISDGCAWVTSRVYPLNVLSEQAGAVIAALFAAAFVERGWPADDSSLERARDFEKRMDVMLADLVESNNAGNETGDYGIDILPMWQFGAPPCTTYW